MVTEAEIERVTLEKVKINARAVTNLEFLEEQGVDVVCQLNADMLTNTLRAFVWGNTIHTATEDYHHPATWWDGFKQAIFPHWLLRRFSVRQTTITIRTEFKHICPHLRLDTQDKMAHIQFLTPPEAETVRE